MKNLSIIIPVYNCCNVILTCIDNIKSIVEKITNSYEIIIVDDGSIDETWKVARSKADENVRVISYYPNVGKGYAIKRGIMSAKGEKIIFIDGDRDIDAELLAIYYNALDYNDVVIGSKYHPASNVKVPLRRYILSKLFNVIVNSILRLDISDTQVGLKAGKAEVFKKIFERVLVKRYAFDVEMLVVARLLDYKIAEMPVNLEINKQFRISEIIRMVIDIAGIAYRLRILNWYNEPEKIEYKPLIPL
ncbi:MAG: glycosyltransferase [Candidatus Nitrosocaldaceae archaeon]